MSDTKDFNTATKVMAVAAVVWLFLFVVGASFWFRAIRQEAADAALVMMQVCGGAFVVCLVFLLLSFVLMLGGRR